MVRVTAAGALFVTLLASSKAGAQGSVCVEVRPGDSAAAIAQRLTGDARNRFAAWFQIVEPASATLVPKVDYDHIRPGWNACIVGAARPAQRELAVASVQDSVDQALGALVSLVRDADSNVVLWLALVITMTLISSSLKDVSAARRPVPEAMRLFAEQFVREFERPLLLGDRKRAIRAQLRANAARSQLEVLLAPAEGRRYPNLSDHRKNVEYDVSRVMRRLRSQEIAGSALYAQGQWVVVRFEFPNGCRQTETHSN